MDKLEATTALEIDLPNFRTVSPALYRGGQPTDRGLQYLRDQLGVRLILNLRDEPSVIERERPAAAALGLRFISVPLSPFDRPAPGDLDRCIELLRAKHNQPAFVHCMLGQERTGMICSIYRMLEHQWTYEQAYAEMVSLGFRPIFSHFVEALERFRTGE